MTTNAATPKIVSEYETIKLAITGNRFACDELVNRYKPSVYNHLIKMSFSHEDAEDLTQEAFLKAFDKLGSYEPNYAFSTWLFRIAINNSIDHFRRKRLEYTSIDAPSITGGDYQLHEKVPMPQDSPEEQMIRLQQGEQVRQMISKLSYKYRLMIELRFYEDMSYEDIAAELDLPLGTVKAQLHRAKELLHGLLLQSRVKAS